MDELMARAVEQSTFAITMAFTDSSGTAVIPDSLSWTLVDINGNVMNSREDVVVAVPAASTVITLSGDDLAIPDSSAKERILLCTGTYTSDLGSGLPLKESVKFFIEDFFQPPEVWKPVIITLSEVRSLLQIASSDNTKDENIKVLIPIMQNYVIKKCHNEFEVTGGEIAQKETIAFVHDDDDTPEITDDGLHFLDEGFDTYIATNSVTGTGIAFVDGGASKDTITDTGNGFISAGFKKGMKFAVLDSESNDGVYTALAVVAGTITVATGTLTAETAGESITVTHGIDIRVDGSFRNDGLYKAKKASTGKLYLFDDAVVVDEKKGSIVSLIIITGVDFPEGIKLPVAKLIGYSLSQKSVGIKSEKIGDYSVSFNIDYPPSLSKDLDPWSLDVLTIATTTNVVTDDDIIIIETELS